MHVFFVAISFMISGLTFQYAKPSLEQLSSEKEAINELINGWHKAAANADFDTFFACMDEEGYYIGTDETEKWSIEEFRTFCKPYFDRGSAWDFKPIERGVYLNEAKDLAWFDEKLDTWMGVCRSSGVVIKSDSGWKIKHYHLSIAVPNDVTNDLIELVKKHKADQTKK